MPPGRLLAAAALFFAIPVSAQAPVRTIELSSFAYRPAAIALAAGQPVTLAFTNRSRDSHDFTAKNFFASSRIVSGSAAGGRIELKGGQSRSVTLIPAAGRYKVHCGHFLHKQFGITGSIVVR